MGAYGSPELFPEENQQVRRKWKPIQKEPKQATAISKYLLWKGRSNRLEYLLTQILIIIMSFGAFCVLGGIIFLIEPSKPIGQFLILDFLAIILYLNVCNAIRRFHDMDKSGWSILWLIVPLANVVVATQLYIVRGNPFINEYDGIAYFNRR